MLLSDPSVAALQLIVFVIGVMSQDASISSSLSSVEPSFRSSVESSVPSSLVDPNFFLAAETVVASLPSGCYSLPIQTDSAIKVSYNDTGDVGLEGPIDFYFNQDGQQTSVFGFQDPATQLNMLFDASDPSQMGIHYPDQSAIVVNSSGITFIAPDCSTVVSLVVPDFLLHVVLAGGSVGTKKKLRRESHPNKRSFLDNVPFDVTVPLVDECGDPPRFEPELDCGQSPCIFFSQTNGIFRWTCLYPGEFSPEAFCEGTMIQLLQSISNAFLGSGTNWPGAVSVFSQYLPVAISALFGIAGFIDWTDLNDALSGLANTALAASIFNSLTIENISTAICQAHYQFQVMNIKLIDRGFTWGIAAVNEAPATTIEYQSTITVDGNHPSGCPTTTESTTTTTDTTTTASSTDTDTSDTDTRTFPTTLDLSDILMITATHRTLSVSVNTATQPVQTACATLARCDTPHVNPCDFDTQQDGSKVASGCACGVNAEGKQRCFKLFDPVLDPEVFCYVKTDCPGDMDCLILNQCWVPGGNGPSNFPGMCLKICIRDWETGN